MKKGILLMGIVLAVVAVIGFFVLGFVVSPAPTVVVAARVDIPAGTRLSDINAETDLVRLPLRGDRKLISSMVSESDFLSLAAAGAVLVEPVYKYEPLRMAAIVSNANPLVGRYPALMLDDPGLMVVRIAVSGNAPNVRQGDHIDLALAVTDLASQQSSMAIQYYQPDYSALYPSMDLGGGPTSTPTQTSTPTLTPTPAMLTPIAKTIVNNAVVVNVVREQQTSGSSASGSTTVIEGDVIAIEVVIPREALELISMANSAGRLTIGLVSPLAATGEGPTMGVSMTDFLEWFYADRAELMPPTETPVPSPIPPTPVPSQTPIPTEGQATDVPSTPEP